MKTCKCKRTKRKKWRRERRRKRRESGMRRERRRRKKPTVSYLVRDLDEQTEALWGFEQQTTRDVQTEVLGFGAGLHLKCLTNTHTHTHTHTKRHTKRQ